MNLVVHHLRFSLRARTLIHLGPQAGAQLRGALWAALQTFACHDPAARSDPAHAAHCPMCHLMALETGQSARGANPPRPFAIQPPLAEHALSDCYFYPDDPLAFGVNLFGDTVNLFPYLCQAVHRMGEIGVGYGRGRFDLERVQAVDPLTGRAKDLLDGGSVVAGPGLPITRESTRWAAGHLSPAALGLVFITPTQIKHRGQMLTRPSFEAVIARLLERCQALETHYTDDPTPQPAWRERYLSLTAAAANVQLVDDQTEWVRVQSGSRRTQSRNSLGGFVGLARYEGDLTPFAEWLVWGQSLHVGKNAVKGNGWYAIHTELVTDLEN